MAKGMEWGGGPGSSARASVPRWCGGTGTVVTTWRGVASFSATEVGEWHGPTQSQGWGVPVWSCSGERSGVPLDWCWWCPCGG